MASGPRSFLPFFLQVLIGEKNCAKVYQKKESFGYENLKME